MCVERLRKCEQHNLLSITSPPVLRKLTGGLFLFIHSMNTAKQFTRVIRWDTTAQHYTGSLPEIAPETCCHGNTAAEVATLLDKIAEQTLADAIPHATPGSAIIIIPQEARNLDTVRLVTDLRRSLGMNQSEFAATLGISKSSLTKWETGERRPDAAALKLLRILRDNPQLITA